MADIDGLHMHSLCEQGYQPLAALVEQIRPASEMARGAFSWLNLGGGHMLTHPDYDTASLTALLTELARHISWIYILNRARRLPLMRAFWLARFWM